MHEILFKILFISFLLFLLPNFVFAEDLEGRIESIDKNRHSFVVQGIEFFVPPSTDYDDGLKKFDDLKIDQKVEVDFEYRVGKHFVTEIELED